MTPFDRYTRDTVMPAIAALLGDRSADRDEPPVDPLLVS